MRNLGVAVVVVGLLLASSCLRYQEGPDVKPQPTAKPPTSAAPPPEAPPPIPENKASSLLLLQVALRQEQMAHPNARRLEQMQAMGMVTDPLGVQRVFVYLRQELALSQLDELQKLGVTVYPDSWIPPVGSHPTGFLLADVPVDRFNEVARVDYVVRMDTAEQQVRPERFEGGR